MIVMELVERILNIEKNNHYLIDLFIFVEGSLDNYLKANELRVPQLIQMCYEIAKGMAYLESCSVIHRYVN
jgi:serine/threonine protein kinase